MPGKARPSLRSKTLTNVEMSNLSTTDKKCIKEIFERYPRMEAEIVKLKGMVDAELDTIHKLGDDYGRALEEHSIITMHLNAEIDRLQSIIKELVGE